jgi:hypothetical protein
MDGKTELYEIVHDRLHQSSDARGQEQASNLETIVDAQIRRAAGGDTRAFESLTDILMAGNVDAERDGVEDALSKALRQLAETL